MEHNWIYYAKLARKLARRVVTGDEVMKDGTRVLKAIDIQDIYATDTLNDQYSNVGSKATVHTWPGGRQEIHTRHADGSEGQFNTDGELQGTSNAMDVEVKKYMTGNLGESIQRIKIRITESDLHRIVRQCVNEALNEIGDTEKGQYALGSVCAKNYKKYKDCYNNYDPNASKYYKTMNDASDIAHNSRLAADGGIEKVRRMGNAYAKGSRNYMSSMNGNGNGDYRNIKIKH